MEWSEKLQQIVDYVEIHLQRMEEPVDKEEIIKMADCSYSFFQKVFSYMIGISFAEYVRNRRLPLQKPFSNFMAFPLQKRGKTMWN